jgi:hypothetical protein
LSLAQLVAESWQHWLSFGLQVAWRARQVASQTPATHSRPLPQAVPSSFGRLMH